MQSINIKRFYNIQVLILGLMMTIFSILIMPVPAGAEISVTVTGDGVAHPTTFNQAQLESMPQVQAHFSTINTWPIKNWYVAKGVKLEDLLTAAGIKDEAQLITITATDGFKKNITRKQLDDPRYYFPGLKENHEFFGHIPGSPDEAVPVHTILALKSVDSNNPAGMNNLGAPLLVMGQRWVTEQSNELFVKYVTTIEVSTANPPKWENPAADQASGIVPAGTGISLSTSDMDGDNIHYTTDGSDPTLQSPMYNWVKKRWWNQRSNNLAEINKPIKINRDTTIKAIAIGPGKEDSDIVSFSYQVMTNPAPVLTPDISNNIVGQSIDITFMDDTAWRAAITAINVDGTTLGATDYTLEENRLVIRAGVLNQAGDYNIVVQAGGYGDAGVTQTILPQATISSPAGGTKYTPGQLVSITGTVAVQVATLNVSVSGPDGNTVFGPQLVEVAEGRFATAFTLSSNAASGIYTVILNGTSLSGAVNAVFTVGGNNDDVIKPVGDVILTVTGSGVRNTVEYDLAMLKAMEQYQSVYSVINTWPTKNWYVGKGVKLTDLIAPAGMNGNAGLIRFTSVDGYTMTLTAKELLNDTRYCFPNFKEGGSDGDGHIPGSSGGAREVEPILALVSAEGTEDPSYMSDLNSLLLMMGQRAVTEQTGQLFVKCINKVEVLAESPSCWDTPQANPDSTQISAGTLIRLSNSNMDDDKIHYTTDGSTPTINSPIYNWISSRWWSSRGDAAVAKINHPIEITKDTTIKALTIGPGKTDSAIATFSYQVKKKADDKIELVTPGQDCTISLDDEAILEIPADALQETAPVEIKIQKIAELPALPASLKLASGIYEFSVNGQNKYRFASNITLKLNFDPQAVGEGEAPVICCYDETLKQWIKLGGTVCGHIITIQVDHFTKFAAMIVENNELIKLKPAVPLINLTDIKDHWAQKTIEALLALDAVAGYPDGSFKPDSPITRAEFTTVLVKAFKLETQNGKNYTDTAGHWAKDYIATAAANEIVSGYNETTFGPDDFITREQMAMMISKAAKLTSVAEETRFNDSDSISGWARSAISTAAQNGILKGYPDSTIRPLCRATRAEAMTVIATALQKLNN